MVRITSSETSFPFICILRIILSSTKLLFNSGSFTSFNASRIFSLVNMAKTPQLKTFLSHYSTSFIKERRRFLAGIKSNEPQVDGSGDFFLVRFRRQQLGLIGIG